MKRNFSGDFSLNSRVKNVFHGTLNTESVESKLYYVENLKQFSLKNIFSLIFVGKAGCLRRLSEKCFTGNQPTKTSSNRTDTVTKLLLADIFEQIVSKFFRFAYFVARRHLYHSIIRCC